jgi:RecA-family ATPase
MAEDSDLSTAQLPNLIKEWMTTEDDMRTLSAELRAKRKRAKLVRSMIMKIMKGGAIGKLNISSGAVVARTKTAKAPLTKKFIADTLTDFFNGDKAMAEKCAAFIDEHRPMKSTENLTLEPK